jgi:hypothetical protein
MASSLAALLTLACAALLWPSGGGAAAQEAKRARWEYGELLAHQAGAEVAASWASPSGKSASEGWKGLLKKLVGQEGQGEAAEVLNALGGQGWEQVAVSERPIQGPRRPAGEALTRWTFKRPK